MKEILIAILLPQLFILPILLAMRNAKKTEGGGGVPVEDYPIINGTGDRVLAILKTCFADLKRQGARGFGPWISALLDGPDMFFIEHDARGRLTVEKEWTGAGPDVALTAVKFTLRDLAGSRFNLDVLNAAKVELEEMMGEWD